VYVFAMGQRKKLKAFAKFASVLAVWLLFCTASVFSEEPRDVRRTETVAPGIEHVEIRRGNFSPESVQDRWTIHALFLEPARVRLILARAMDEIVGTETTTSMAARYGALAAVNGGYFRTIGVYRGEPTGFLSLGNRLMSEPTRRRAGLAVANEDGRVRIAFAVMQVKARILVPGGVSRSVEGFNRPRETNELIVYTSDFHRTTLTGQDGIEAVLRPESPSLHQAALLPSKLPAVFSEISRIIDIRDRTGSLAIPAQGFVLSAEGEARTWVLKNIRLGSRIEIQTEFEAEPPLPFPAEFMIGAGPVLLRSGRALNGKDREDFAEDFRLNRHPRTAIGTLKDGRVVLVTVDGRQPKVSVGMTIAELSALMLELGSVDALNLDGGGSTTMVIKGRVVNNPSDATGERPVSDALLVFAR
jgi:exopolysaccharide biosynthesis protein